MKVVNFMNFVREYDPRMNDDEKSREVHFETTVKELELAREFGVASTFLLQYDALIDEKYISLFKKESGADTEVGLWFEVVRPLTDKVGLKWRGNPDWRWDWKIIPGFLMAYTIEERKLLVDEAMNKFREIYGYYPKTVASWLLDTYSAQYLSEKYAVSALAICRDQVSTDAYTLIGGYFNQGYYPSKNNIFTPAQSDAMRINTPVFRLLGPDPIHNYDSRKYMVNSKNEGRPSACCTLEPVWKSGYDPRIVDWFFKTYYENENLGFSYAQIGQENSFAGTDPFLPALKMQLEKLTKYDDVTFMTMGATGEWFKNTYKNTPATAVVATEDWDGADIDCVYYDCQNYMANIFRNDNKVFIRCMYLFNENNKEHYLDTPCQTWDATYENLPLADTIIWEDRGGIVLDTDGENLDIEKIDDKSLKVSWNNKCVELYENEIIMKNITPVFDTNGNKANIRVSENSILYTYNDINYRMRVENGHIEADNGVLTFIPEGDTLRVTMA